eukprot:768378-Hanusia_phi.AAC.3
MQKSKCESPFSNETMQKSKCESPKQQQCESPRLCKNLQRYPRCLHTTTSPSPRCPARAAVYSTTL